MLFSRDILSTCPDDAGRIMCIRSGAACAPARHSRDPAGGSAACAVHGTCVLTAAGAMLCGVGQSARSAVDGTGRAGRGCWMWLTEPRRATVAVFSLAGGAARLLDVTSPQRRAASSYCGGRCGRRDSAAAPDYGLVFSALSISIRCFAHQAGTPTQSWRSSVRRGWRPEALALPAGRHPIGSACRERPSPCRPSFLRRQLLR